MCTCLSARRSYLLGPSVVRSAHHPCTPNVSLCWRPCSLPRAPCACVPWPTPLPSAIVAVTHHRCCRPPITVAAIANCEQERESFWVRRLVNETEIKIMRGTRRGWVREIGWERGENEGFSPINPIYILVQNYPMKPPIQYTCPCILIPHHLI